jgi:hypothetical protein
MPVPIKRIQTDSTPLINPMPFSAPSLRLSLASIVHKLEQMDARGIKEGQDRDELVSLFGEARDSLKKEPEFTLRNIGAAQSLAAAIRLYLFDLESGDRRLKPAMATVLIATEMDTKDHPRTVNIQNLIDDIEATIFQAKEREA